MRQKNYSLYQTKKVTLCIRQKNYSLYQTKKLLSVLNSKYPSFNICFLYDECTVLGVNTPSYLIHPKGERKSAEGRHFASTHKHRTRDRGQKSRLTIWSNIIISLLFDYSRAPNSSHGQLAFSGFFSTERQLLSWAKY